MQQDPSRGWLDSAPHDPKRWLFVGGTSVNGSRANPSGVPIIELFGSRAGGDWTQGFEYAKSCDSFLYLTRFLPLSLSYPARIMMYHLFWAMISTTSC